jgi:hypothetical protein
MPDDHLHDEALSDALDGTAPSDVSSHLASCAECRSRLDAMGAASQAVAAPPPAPSEADRDAAIARALDSTASPVRRLPVIAPWMAAAALVAVLLGIGGIVLAGRDDAGDRQTTAAGQADTKALAEAGTAGVVDGGDLGDQRDTVALNALLQERLGGSAGGASARTFAEQDGTTPNDQAAPPEAPTAAAATAAPACLSEAQTAASGRAGALVLTARLRWQGEAAVVLVFSAPDQPQLGRRAFVMARRDCRLLVVQSF